VPDSYWNRTSAFSTVFQIPQARGMPTKSQNTQALASSPPVPMPKEPEVVAAFFSCSLARSRATSSSVICHFGLTGQTKRLAINPTTSIPAKM
jgi:hypothetical protein